jgi:hypothetical protein
MAVMTSDAISSIATMVVSSSFKANIVGTGPRRKPRKSPALETYLSRSGTRNKRLMRVLPTPSLTSIGKMTNLSWFS